MKRSVLSILVLAALGTVARAEPPKYTKQEANIQATQTALTKPTLRAKEEKKRPEISAGDVFQGVGEQLKQVTDAQIAVLKRLIDNTGDDDPEKPDLHFRMAELFAEQEHYFNFRARELDAKIFDAQQQNKPNEVARLKKLQEDYEKKEKQWLAAAVKEYVKVTGTPDRPNEKFANYQRMDQVLFYLAFLLTQQKREDLARPYFKRLIKDHPKSQYIPDAYLSFGQYYFDAKDIENALKFYDKVLQFPDSRVYSYAQYMEGWCYFNLQDFKKALEIFVTVITQTKAKKGESNKIALIKEAKKDSVRAYSQIAPADKAWPFFQRIGGDYAFTMMEQLAELYNSQGKFDESIKAYRQLMKIDPNSPKLCNWQTEVLRNTLSRTGSNAHPDSVQELQRLSALYEKYKSMKGMKQDAIDECRDNTAGSLRELATTWHKEAQRTGVQKTYDLAHYLYKEYITRFPHEKDIYPMTFYYGELLFKLEKFCDAAPVYTDVVKLDPTDKAKYRNEAAYAAVISYKNCFNVDESRPEKAPEQKAEKGKKGKGEKTATAAKEEKKVPEPKPIPEKWQKMLGAFDTYIKYVPSSKELPNIKYTKARVYYEHDHYAEAAELFRDLVEHHRDSDLAIYSTNLLFDCYNVLDQYEKLEEDSKRYCAMPELNKDQDIKNQCATIQNGIARKKIEKWEKDGQFRKAADMYLKLAEEHPDDPRLAELYYNAAVDYEKSKAIGAAIVARRNLINLKPNDPLAKKAIYQIGRAYQDIAEYEKAAENYEKFASDFPGEKAPTDASLALYTASFFRRGLGDIDKSISDTNLFIKNYGPRKEYEDKAAGVYFEMGTIFEQQKDWDKFEKHLKSYLKTWGAKGGVDRQIVANVKLGELKWRQSCPAPGGGVNGACIEITRIRASSATRVAEKAKKGKRKKKGAQLPAQCGPETKSKITLHERKPALAKEAQGFFSAALKLAAAGAAKKVPGKDELERNRRIEAMNYAIAQARMMQGDQEYEKLLAMKIPDKLDFTPADPNDSPARQAKAKKRLEEAQKKFKAWIDGKGKQLALAQKIYLEVIELKQAHWAIAASARVGQLFQDFSGQLYTAPVPKAPPTPPGLTAEDWEQTFHDAYCDAMVDSATPLEEKAIQGLSACLSTSTRLSWYNEWSQLCEAELNQIKPAEYPLAAELRALPGYFDRKADAAPLISELK